MAGRAGRRADSGSAIAEFVMVSILLIVVSVSVFQLGLALYVRNTLLSCASEGARFGARANSSLAQGAARATTLITTTLSDGYAGNVTATTTTVDGVQVVEVTVVAPLPVIGLLGPTGTLEVSGRAFLEDQQ